MKSLQRALLVAVFASSITGHVVAGEPEVAKKWGHSLHGSHYDSGPRSKLWKMEGIGSTHFPVTSSNPEVQQWFDQGHTLLHSF